MHPNKVSVKPGCATSYVKRVVGGVLVAERSMLLRQALRAVSNMLAVPKPSRNRTSHYHDGD